jgi:hypothetical protein
MHRQAAGRDQHDVEAHVAPGVVRAAGEPELGGGHDALLLAAADRFRRVGELLSTPRRRATMSISPTGVLKRRARIR